MSLVVINVKVVGEYEIEIFFENGQHGCINIARMINFEGKFSNLRDPIYFASVQVDSNSGTIFWRNGESIEVRELFMKIINDSQRLFPYKDRLRQPSNSSLLYKIVKFENLIDMCTSQYLWFNNVTCYKDDLKDSDMPEPEKRIREMATFENNPNISISDFDKITRTNTYACCFTLEESNYIWKHYASDLKNDLCLVFDLEKLTKYFIKNYCDSYFLNGEITQVDNFHINSGLVKYIDFEKRLTNPGDPYGNLYDYAYKKSAKYKKENEFRITLNPDFQQLPSDAPEFLKLFCDWNSLVECGALTKIKSLGKLSRLWLESRLRNLL